MIRRYIAWRNRHRDDEALRAISKRAKVAWRGTSSRFAHEAGLGAFCV